MTLTKSSILLVNYFAHNDFRRSGGKYLIVLAAKWVLFVTLHNRFIPFLIQLLCLNVLVAVAIFKSVIATVMDTAADADAA